CRYRNLWSSWLIAPAGAAEPTPKTIPTARNASEQDQDRGDDPDNRRKAERDADRPNERCYEHGNQDADHLSGLLPCVDARGSVCVLTTAPRPVYSPSAKLPI